MKRVNDECVVILRGKRQIDRYISIEIDAGRLEVWENIVIEQSKKKTVYDAAHAACPFKNGSKVLLHSSRQLTRMAEQLEENFTGPYIIHRLTKANTAYLTKMDGTVLKKTVSCARLKLFINKPASTAVTITINKSSDKSESEAYDSLPAKKICLSPPAKKTSLSPPNFQSTPIPIDSDALINDVNTNCDLHFKPPTKGYMIINSAPLDVHRNVIVRPKFGTARMFSRTAAPKPKNIRKIIADGNCLFRAFSFCLTGSEEHHLTVRRVICDYMEFFSSVWQPLVGNRTITEYLDRGVRTSGIGREHWGTEIEILAFADMCNCMVYVYNDHGSARKIKQYKGYGPRPRADRSAQDIADLTTFLLYNAYNHFEVVLSP
uniref:OTU domain-containing protein n=1 Tax=Plectus sambesii TaxID=2011161 RepID=A0A914WWA7_9BILA